MNSSQFFGKTLRTQMSICRKSTYRSMLSLSQRITTFQPLSYVIRCFRKCYVITKTQSLFFFTVSISMFWIWVIWRRFFRRHKFCTVQWKVESCGSERIWKDELVAYCQVIKNYAWKTELNDTILRSSAEIARGGVAIRKQEYQPFDWSSRFLPFCCFYYC